MPASGSHVMTNSRAASAMRASPPVCPGQATLQLDQPLLHRGWLGQQPPRLIRQTRQHRLARLGHFANLPVTQRCCTGARPPPLGDPPSPPGPMHDGRPRACLSCTVSGRPSEISACGRRTPSAPSPVAARRCVRRVPTRSPLSGGCARRCLFRQAGRGDVAAAVAGQVSAGFPRADSGHPARRPAPTRCCCRGGSRRSSSIPPVRSPGWPRCRTAARAVSAAAPRSATWPDCGLRR